ncbi:nucleoside-diphosphate kinase [Candidatus Parcubacteria bacterium]|nr:nucleoside-diphosphate kinase [Candidatus Parcubacteria bacterium]
MNNPQEERTVILIKPDGVKRGLVGEIISRLEARGLKIIALELFSPTRNQIDDHYPKDETWIRRIGGKTASNYKNYGLDLKAELGSEDLLEIGNMVRGWVLDYMTSGPIVKMVVQGIHSINMGRKIAGSSMPSEAEMGTIRGDFSVDDATAANRNKRAIHNLIHASETHEEAEHEIGYWFSPEEIHSYKRAEEDIMF